MTIPASVPVAYISGACTHPAYRERGVMRKLLAQAHQSTWGSASGTA